MSIKFDVGFKSLCYIYFYNSSETKGLQIIVLKKKKDRVNLTY